jgi:tRNA-splicing ligase RtcB
MYMEKIITDFSINIDKDTKKQFEDCYNEKFVIKASLMPDAHLGYVAPIGSVIVTKNFVVPSWVGFDIGCGMIACQFIKKDILKLLIKKKKIIFQEVIKKIPMGKGKINENKNITNKTKEDFKNTLNILKEKETNREILRFLKTQSLAHLGSLGSGNHFIELGYNQTYENNDELWLIIHSGSRGIGHKIATYYMREAANNNEEFEKTYPLDIKSNMGKEYINSLNFALDFALLNRLEMAYQIRNIIKDILNFKELDFNLWVNKNHNHAIVENNQIIHRKGATPAKKNERGVIPANMKDGSFLVEGLGNKDFLESSSHGAGRILSRKEAKIKLSLDDFKKDMGDIIGVINDKTIDESPKAYKNIFDVMEFQKDSVKIIAHIKPIINWKG